MFREKSSVMVLALVLLLLLVWSVVLYGSLLTPLATAAPDSVVGGGGKGFEPVGKRTARDAGAVSIVTMDDIEALAKAL